jgi:hypothetical protein
VPPHRLSAALLRTEGRCNAKQHRPHRLLSLHGREPRYGLIVAGALPIPICRTSRSAVQRPWALAGGRNYSRFPGYCRLVWRQIFSTHRYLRVSFRRSLPARQYSREARHATLLCCCARSCHGCRDAGDRTVSTDARESARSIAGRHPEGQENPDCSRGERHWQLDWDAWSAPLGVDRCDAFQLAICRACSSSNLTGLLYPSAEWRRLAL